MPYAPVTITGYNANPPEDDGTEASSNEISWAKHKEKIGDPLKTAIEATQTAITTVTDSIEADLIEAGTVMLFVQTAAPTGWTKDTTHNDKALRVVSGTVVNGGTAAFTTAFAARTILLANLPSTNLSSANLSITGSPSITGSQVGGLVRNLSTPSATRSNGNGANFDYLSSSSFSETTLDASSGTLDVGGSVPLGGSGTAMDFAVAYVDVIIATKD